MHLPSGAGVCCQPGLQGGLCRGGQPGGSTCLWAAGLEAGLRQRDWSEPEIPWRSSPLTYLLLSPPNLLTFGKGESRQFACFSKFPPLPWVSPASARQPWHRGGHRPGRGGRRATPEPSAPSAWGTGQCPLAPGDATRRERSPCAPHQHQRRAAGRASTAPEPFSQGSARSNPPDSQEFKMVY